MVRFRARSARERGDTGVVMLLRLRVLTFQILCLGVGQPVPPQLQQYAQAPNFMDAQQTAATLAGGQTHINQQIQRVQQLRSLLIQQHAQNALRQAAVAPATSYAEILRQRTQQMAARSALANPYLAAAQAQNQAGPLALEHLKAAQMRTQMLQRHYAQLLLQQNLSAVSVRRCVTGALLRHVPVTLVYSPSIREWLRRAC